MKCDIIMAVQGAHLTSTTSDDTNSPSIFEVLAQESLVHTLKPTLQHLLRVLAERNPDRYGPIYRYCDEVYLCLQFILENYYLRHYSSSFSENFYGMKRTVIVETNSLDSNSGSKHDKEENGDKLSNVLPQSQRWKSLFFLVLVPYVKNKLEVYYEQLSNSYEENNRQHHNVKYLRAKKFLCKAFLGAYPILHAVWESTMLTYQLAYIFGKSTVHTPFLKWAGVMLQSLSEGDFMSDDFSEPFSLQSKSFTECLTYISGRVMNGLAVTLSTGLSVGVFFLQFLEWWYASDQKSDSLIALPNPPPPPSQHSALALHTLCPLCQRVRTNDTVLAVSGFVFCYSCIYQYVLENNCCPVTNYPATPDHLVRLYLPES